MISKTKRVEDDRSRGALSLMKRKLSFVSPGQGNITSAELELRLSK